MQHFLNRVFVITTLLGSMAFASAAQAGLIVDIEDLGMERVFEKHYTHTLNEPGEDPFVLGSAISATIEIETFIETDCNLLFCADEWLPHVVLVVIEDFDFDTGGLTIGTFINDLEIEALAALNADGMLEVTVKSFNDFKIGLSTLTVRTSSVPEPGTLSLLGAGLLGLGLMQRRRRRSA